MSTLSTFAARFKELRESAGLKQSEIGEKLGVSRGAISFYENCDRTPDIEFAAKAAKFFCVSADWLLGLSDYQNTETAGLTVESIGLSEQAANALVNLARSSDIVSENKISTLNLMLEDDVAKGTGTQLLRYIADYLSAPEISNQIVQFTHGEVRILNIDSGLSKDFPPNCESVNMLYDKALIDRIVHAIDGTRFQFRYSTMANALYGEEVNNGELQTDD